jgi:hypothetical protein
MQEYKVVICGLTKNSEQYIMNHMLKLSTLGKLFSQYKIIIYENDSTDKTVEKFKTFKKHCSHFFYISEQGIVDKYNEPHRRVKIISHGRNKILNLIFQKYSTYDLMIMVDLDNVFESFSPSEFLKQISCYTSQSWDVLTANCDGPYYDIWALRIPPTVWKNEIHGKIWEKPLSHDCWNEMVDSIPPRICIKQYQKKIPYNLPLIETESSFNGLGIYKLSAIKNCTYDPYNRDDNNTVRFVQCEHVSFHRQIRKNGFRIFICPSMLMKCATDHIQEYYNTN